MNKKKFNENDVIIFETNRKTKENSEIKIFF